MDSSEIEPGQHRTTVNLSGYGRPSIEHLVEGCIRRHLPASKRPVIVAVGGPGGTGKSLFCQRLAVLLDGAAILACDDYRTPRAQRSKRGLFGSHPEGNHLELLSAHLQCIRDNVAFEAPRFCTDLGEAHAKVPFQPTPFTILDGEISTYTHFQAFVDFRIYIDSDWRLQLKTRLSRDITERAASREKALTLFLKSNLQDAARFGAEAKILADLVLHAFDDYHLTITEATPTLKRHIRELILAHRKANDLRGLIVPVTTPFTDGNELDIENYTRHIAWLETQGVRQILVNGTTSEFYSLTVEERRRLFLAARKRFRHTLIFHAGYSGFQQTIEDLLWAQDRGCDAIAVITPYFLSHVEDAGIVAYYQRMAERCKVPLILYHFPRHTQVTFTPEILRQIPHFGLKDSSADLGLIPCTPRYFVGSDTHAARCLRAGGAGWVSAHANHEPALHLSLATAVNDGDDAGAELIQDRINVISRATGRSHQIAKVKQSIARHLPGYPANVRPPLRNLPQA